MSCFYCVKCRHVVDADFFGYDTDENGNEYCEEHYEEEFGDD